jgi:lipopolysaccharide transport protein LptA
MEYDLESGVIRMSKDAWLSDGANEVSGNRIAYDLVSEYIIADSDETGQVRMKISPPQDDRTESTP